MARSILIVATLLVATVAGQSLWEFGKNVPSSLTSRWEPRFSGGRRLLGHPLERSLIYGQSLQVPSYLQDDIFDVSTLQLDDVITHPLFPVYMGLPYFRQYWGYPMFQRYVSSQYFQRFWNLPSFYQYFENPVLFYKYIFPLVTLFKDTTSYGYPYTTNWPYYTTPYGYGQQQGQDYAQEVYSKALLENMMHHLHNNQQQQDNQISLQDVIKNVPEAAKDALVTAESVEKIVEPTNEVIQQKTAGETKLVEVTKTPVELVNVTDAATTATPATHALPEQQQKARMLQGRVGGDASI